MTPEQYLEIERAAELRHEYYKGKMYEKPTGTFYHTLIMTNLSIKLRNRMKQTICFTACIGLRVHPSHAASPTPTCWSCAGNLASLMERRYSAEPDVVSRSLSAGHGAQ